MEQKENFISGQVKELLGPDEFQELLNFAETHPHQPESIRINSLRVNVKEYLEEAKERDIEFTKLEAVKDAYYVSMPGPSRSWWNQERLMGKFYSQGNASMLPPLFLLNKEDKFASLKVLDMCAAPGSKTTQIGSMMRNNGLLVANDYKSHRLYALHRNLQVFGISNAVVTQLDGRWIASRWPNTFDRTLLDAPCSGTGSSRNKLFSHRTKEAVMHFQKKQKGLLSSAVASVKNENNAYLIYSTCSLLPQENEMVIQPLLEKNKVQIEPLDISRVPGWNLQTGLTEWQDESFSSQFKNALRINPHKNDSDAFFIAKLKVIGA